MKEQTDLPLPAEPGATPFATLADNGQQPSMPEPLTLTPPPIPWEELNRRHKAATGD